MFQARVIKAGVLYCLVVFGAGFVLGVMRNLWVAPLAGHWVSVALEAPILLAIAWNTCGWVAERLEVSQQFLCRLAMSGLALALLAGAEVVVAVLADGGSMAEYFHSYAWSVILLGALTQLAFAVFGLLRRGANPDAL